MSRRRRACTRFQPAVSLVGSLGSTTPSAISVVFVSLRSRINSDYPPEASADGAPFCFNADQFNLCNVRPSARSWGFVRSYKSTLGRWLNGPARIFGKEEPCL